MRELVDLHYSKARKLTQLTKLMGETDWATWPAAKAPSDRSGKLCIAQPKGTPVPKFVTIGYGDQEGYDRTAVGIRDAAHAHDAKLRKDGVLMGIAGTPVQVRNANAAKVETTDGPFMVSSLPLAGFAIIEAASLAEAIDLVARTPCAVAHGVVEVWPLEQAP